MAARPVPSSVGKRSSHLQKENNTEKTNPCRPCFVKLVRIPSCPDADGTAIDVGQTSNVASAAKKMIPAKKAGEPKGNTKIESSKEDEELEQDQLTKAIAFHQFKRRHLSHFILKLLVHRYVDEQK